MLPGPDTSLHTKHPTATRLTYILYQSRLCHWSRAHSRDFLSSAPLGNAKCEWEGKRAVDSSSPDTPTTCPRQNGEVELSLGSTKPRQFSSVVLYSMHLVDNHLTCSDHVTVKGNSTVRNWRQSKLKPRPFQNTCILATSLYTIISRGHAFYDRRGQWAPPIISPGGTVLCRSVVHNHTQVLSKIYTRCIKILLPLRSAGRLSRATFMQGCVVDGHVCVL